MSYLICGVDEVGRGSLAGPMMAVASLFYVPESDWALGSPIEGVQDSKKFNTPEKREQVFERILRCAELVDFGIGMSSVKEIDEKGIDYANRMVFHRAVVDLTTEPQFVLVDGTTPVPVWDRSKQLWKPKADALWWPVSAASILAKVIRDRHMADLHSDFPQYDWAKNAGYGSPKHQKALQTIGACEHHRAKFVQKILSKS